MKTTTFIRPPGALPENQFLAKCVKCGKCMKACPTSPKAIKFVLVQTQLPDGTVATQKAPVIDQDLCIGCGICENKCPVVDDPAIFVTSIGEQRSETNRLLLPIVGNEGQE